MIHPSYVELMNVVNKSGKTGDAPVINSRYSIVAATAKRARQIVDGSETYVVSKDGDKALSVAIDELYSGKLKILTEEEAATKDLELIEFRQQQQERMLREAEEKRLKEEALAKEAEEADEEAVTSEE